MSAKAEEFTVARSDAGWAVEHRVTGMPPYFVCYTEAEKDAKLIADALAFFERKEAIRAAIAGLKHCSNEPGIESYSTACVDAALAAFDREAK